MATGDGTKLHGKNGAIYLGGAKGAPGAVKLSAKTEWTLSLGRDYVDSTTFGATNKTYLVGLKDIQGTFAGLLDVSGDWQVNAANSDALNIYLYADDNPNGATSEIMIAHGPGLIDASITASNTDAIKTTGNFRASGNWTVFSSGSLT
jgi:hypothetical protein